MVMKEAIHKVFAKQEVILFFLKITYIYRRFINKTF